MQRYGAWGESEGVYINVHDRARSCSQRSNAALMDSRRQGCSEGLQCKATRLRAKEFTQTKMTEPEAAVNAAVGPLWTAVTKPFKKVAMQGSKGEGEGVYIDVHD